MFNQLNSADWDVLIYVASYISGHQERPSRTTLVQAGLSPRVVTRLLNRGALAEVDGGLEPVLHTLGVTMRTAA